MKKKIVALALLLCMLVGILSGCAYSYAEDDMSKYVVTTADELKAALASLEIVDGDFTTDEETRQKKVTDAIMTTLAALGESKTEGVADAGDKLTYRYFALLSSDLTDANLNLLDYDDLAARALFASNMTATAQTAILGLNFASDFEKALFEAIKAYTFAETSNYATESSDTTVALDDVIFASFKRTYKDQNNNDVTETFTSVRLWNSKNTMADPSEYTPATDDILFDNFIGKKTTDTIADFEYTDADGVKYSCTSVKLNAIVKTPAAAYDDAKYGAPVTFTCTPYPDSTTQTAVSANGTSIKIGGVELTYFVYPISFADAKKIDDCTAEYLIRDVIAADITTDMFEDNLSKTATGGTTLETLIAGDSTSSEAAMVDSLATIFSYIKTPANHADVTAGSKTESEIKTLYNGYLDSRIEKIATIDGVDAFFVEDYKASVYDSLEATYISDIKEKLSEKFHHVVMDIEIKKNSDGSYVLPEDAVDEIYDIFYENEKYTFNYGYDSNTASATYNQPNYKIYGGSFDKYLIKNFTTDGAGTAKEARAAIRASAEEFVATAVKIHFAAEVIGALISDEDFDERYESWYANFQYQSQIYAYLGYSYPDPGKTGMRLAFQAQDVYDALLYVKGEKEAIDAYLAAYESNPETATYDFDNVVYTEIDGVKYLDFVNIKYKTTK